METHIDTDLMWKYGMTEWAETHIDTGLNMEMGIWNDGIWILILVLKWECEYYY